MNIRLLERRVTRVLVVRSGPVEPEAVLLALQVAAHSVLQGCDDRGWSSTDVDELRAARNALCDLSPDPFDSSARAQSVVVDGTIHAPDAFVNRSSSFDASQFQRDRPAARRPGCRADPVLPLP